MKSLKQIAVEILMFPFVISVFGATVLVICVFASAVYHGFLFYGIGYNYLMNEQIGKGFVNMFLYSHGMFLVSIPLYHLSKYMYKLTDFINKKYEANSLK